MKIVIRSGVFETNSSSTHSFTIVKAEEKQKRQQKVDSILEEIEKLKAQETAEGDKNSPFDGMSIYYKIDELKEEAESKMVSFEIKSPLAKLVWLKGLIDNARSQEGYNEVDNSKRDKCSNEVDEFYGYLKDEYCRIENITEEEADERIITEGSKVLPFEIILRHPESIEEEVKNLLKTNDSFKKFAKKYTDKVQAFKDYVKKFNAEICQSCDGKISCDHYFEEGALDDCYCGFEDYDAIYYSLEKAKNGLSLKEFAKEFITEKYSVFGTERWNAFDITITGEVY